jgi:hypothetical protein
MSPAKINTKTCRLCNEHLPIECFDRRPSQPTHGYKASCKKCLSERGHPEVRFWKFVKNSSHNECWEWTGTQNHSGYGLYTVGDGKRRRKTHSAHRYSWVLKFGPVPDGLFVCHRCDNRSCVNPDHLFLGTAKDNMVDASDKMRMSHGEHHHETTLTEEMVTALRAEYATTGKSTRDLAQEFGISPSSAWRIINRKTWKHIA